MDKRRVLILAPLPAQLIGAMLEACGEKVDISGFQFATWDGTERAELLEAVRTAEIVLGDHTGERILDAEVIGAMEECRFIQQPSTNYSNIDIDAAAEKRIPVAIVGAENPIAVAEHVITLTLASMKKLMLQYARTMSGYWESDTMAQFGIFELNEKLFGFIGMDDVAREVAVRVQAFGCRTAYYSRERLPEKDEAELGLTFMELETLAENADVLSIHLPDDNTECLVDGDLISLMRPTVVITNVSSAAAINELSLASALLDGHVAGAAIDVLNTEPPDEDNPLMKAPNLVITPRSAGRTSEGQMREIMAAVTNLALFMKGQPVKNVINGIAT